jgi:hypothetical protein
MKRTAPMGLVLAAVGLFVAVLPGQQPAAAEKSQVDAVQQLVDSIAAAEKAATTIRVELRSKGLLPDGLVVETRGTLRVLRAEQSDLPAYLHTRVEYSFADGIAGVVESNRTQNGIEIYEDNPAFGESYVHLAPPIVADLEWAGEVLERADLPGMADRRAESPLGSQLLADLHRRFLLTIENGRRGDDQGVWLRGPRRAAPQELDADLPRADRVEVFVRDRDKALLAMRQLQGDREVQSVELQRVELGVRLQIADLRVDGRNQRVREVQQYLPLWEQIEDIVGRAEAKASRQLAEAAAASGTPTDPAASQRAVRPSKRQ